ncbi:MAG TPA: nuclear transport factor 2 family protein [Blastocatellia bacterium]|nr:nuclear transport factor 2 family protein [Blastocatellia bacterium]
MRMPHKTPTALLVLLFCTSVMCQQGSNAKRAPSTDFAALIKGYYEAWNNHDPEKAGQYYAKEAGLIFYDIAPLKYQSWAEYKAGVKKDFFDQITTGTLTPYDDLKVTRRGNIAWTTVTFHLSVKFKSGESVEVDCRHTAIWEKVNNKWLIVHEHVSSPLGGN